MAANGGVGLNNRAESTFRRMISDIIMERGKVNCAETVEGTIGDLQTMTRGGNSVFCGGTVCKWFVVVHCICMLHT